MLAVVLAILIAAHPAPAAATTYVLSDGFDLVCSLVLEKDSSFQFAWSGCLGPIALAKGTYLIADKTIRLRPDQSDFKRNIITFADEMHAIRWGEREYLIPERRMIDFVNAVNSGVEPRTSSMGLFYMRQGDEEKRAAGDPDLPGDWKSFLLAKPVSGRVLQVLQRETSSQRPIVVIDAGARNGLRKGMTLHSFNPDRPSFSADLTVVEVSEASSTAIVTLQYRHIRKGDSFSSRVTR